MQNSSTRVVCKTSKFCHITPVLHSLRWLRIKYRIYFKITTSVYKTLHTNQPIYLRELLSLSEKQRTRASGTRELIRSRSPKTKAGSRAFYVVAPYLWKYEQLRRIPSSAKNYRHTSLHLVSHPNSLTSCCSYFDDFDWPWTWFLTMIWFEAPLSLLYRDLGALEVLSIHSFILDLTIRRETTRNLNFLVEYLLSADIGNFNQNRSA